MLVFETSRLRSRTYTMDDHEALHTILSNSRTMAFWPQPFAPRQTEQWIQNAIHSYESDGFGRWAIVLKSDGTLIGDAGIMRRDIDGTIENDLGNIVAADYWGHGYGLEAARGCMDYSSEVLKLDRLCANMPHDHHSSEVVAIRLGMKLDKQFLNKRNRDILTKVYSIQLRGTR